MRPLIYFFKKINLTKKNNIHILITEIIGIYADTYRT